MRIKSSVTIKMKTEDACHHLFSTYSSGLRVWYLVSLPTNTVSVQYQGLWDAHGAYHLIRDKLNKGNKNAPVVQYPMESGSIFTPWSVSSIVYVVLLLFPVLSGRQRWRHAVAGPLVAPHPGPKQNPFLFSLNFFILSWYKIDTIENMVCFFSANHLLSGKL